MLLNLVKLVAAVREEVALLLLNTLGRLNSSLAVRFGIKVIYRCFVDLRQFLLPRVVPNSAQLKVLPFLLSFCRV